MPSKVWRVFTKVSSTTVKCTICDRVLGYKGGSTGAMLNHMKTHPNSIEDDRQPRLSSFNRQCNPDRAQRISNLIADMIAKDGLPINFVEGEGFRALMHDVEPDFTIPSRQTVMRILELKFLEQKTKIKHWMSGCEHIAITTDCWTSLGQEGFMTVTAHGIDNEWIKRSFVLNTSPVASLDDNDDDNDPPLPQRHTSQALKSQLREVAQTWEINNKVCGVVHDNAANVRVIGEAVGAPDVPCTAHTLQLCVNAGLNSNGQLQRVIGAVSRLVGHFKHSVVASQALTAKQDQHNLPKHRLIQSVKTRWNSVYDMFARVTEQRWAITSVLSDERLTLHRDATTLQLKDEHWSIVDNMGKTLEPFLVSTIEIIFIKYILIILQFSIQFHK